MRPGRALRPHPAARADGEETAKTQRCQGLIVLAGRDVLACFGGWRAWERRNHQGIKDTRRARGISWGLEQQRRRDPIVWSLRLCCSMNTDPSWHLAGCSGSVTLRLPCGGLMEPFGLRALNARVDFVGANLVFAPTNAWVRAIRFVRRSRARLLRDRRSC